MAKYKIDATKIDGFDAMSDSDKIAALLKQEIEVEAPADDSNKLKQALSKANSEAAEFKRQLREKQTEAERAEAERAENEKTLREELAAYKTRERISNYKAQLMTAGIDAATADIMAKSLPDGVGDDYFAATKSFLESQKQQLLSEALNKQPGLSVGNPPTAKDAEQAELAKYRKYIGL